MQLNKTGLNPVFIIFIREEENMTDITVQEIIATFKNIEREEIYSSVQSDDFLEIMKKKKHWTLEEYQEFRLEYDLKYMNIAIFDLMAIISATKKYNFQLDWNHYFKVIESVPNVREQKKYVNYYLWNHHKDVTEEVYQELMKKTYFKLLTSKGKSHFLSHALTTNNINSWTLKYFTDEEIKNSWKTNTLKIPLRASNNNVTLEKIEQVKDFYNQYESFMDYKTKVRFFHQAITSGVIPLIQFLYQDKGIKKLNEVKVLWHVCSDITSRNTIEILQCLKDMGFKLTPGVLKKSQAHYQWDYMEHNEKLTSFIMDPIRERNYLKLDNKIQNKPERTTVRKI